jgi:hypothetical protein
VVVEYIDAHRVGLGVDPICRVLSEQAGVRIAPCTYYAAKQHGPVSVADLGDAYDANTLFRPVGGQPPRLRRAQAVARRQTRGSRLGPRPGGAADGHRRH